MKSFPNKRKNETFSKQELFQVKNINKLLEEEQRADEIEKIKEVKEQDKTYYYTLGACVLMIMLLSASALFGGYK